MYIACSKSNASYFFASKTDTKSTVTLFDRVNSQLQNTIFFFFFLTPSPTLKLDWEDLHFVVSRLYMAVWNMSSLSHCCHCCWNGPLTDSLCSHPLFHLQKHSASVNECQWLPFFHMVEFSSTPLLCTRFEVRPHSVRLPSIVRQKKCKRISVGRP